MRMPNQPKAGSREKDRCPETRCTSSCRRGDRYPRRVGAGRSGRGQIDTSIRFFDHMLELLAKHGFFDLTIQAKGDIDIDEHHTVEDVGITMGKALHQALGEKAGSSDSGGPRCRWMACAGHGRSQRAAIPGV